MHRAWQGKTWMVGLALSLGVGSLAAADWPQFRGPGGQGVSSETGLPIRWSGAENLRWKTPLPGAGTSSPVIVGERIFLSCYSGFGVPGQPGAQDRLERSLVCLDRAAGRLLWKSVIPGNGPEQETIREGHGYASGTPAADRERVFASFGKAGVFAFDHVGNRLWRADIGSGLHGWGSAGSPILFRDLVIVNAGVESESLVALNRNTGREVWRARGIRESWNTPILVSLPNGKTELVAAVLGKVLGFDPGTGAQLWSCNTDIPWYMAPSLVADKGILYCVGGRTGGSLAIRAGGRGDVTGSHRLWTARKGSNVSSPVLAAGHLFWMHESLGIAYCANLADGRLLYEERLERAGQVYASPVAAEGRLYYLTRDGRTFVLAAQPRFSQLAVNDLRDGSTFNASPAVSHGRLYIRSDRFLYCIGSR